MAFVVSVKSKQTIQQQQNQHSESKCGKDWDVICFCTMQRRGFVVAPCMVICVDEGPDLLCLLFFLFSLVGCMDVRKPSVFSSEGG